MKKYLALGLLSSLLLTSCSVDWNDAKEKRTDNSSGIVYKTGNTDQVESVSGTITSTGTNHKWIQVSNTTQNTPALVESGFNSMDSNTQIIKALNNVVRNKEAWDIISSNGITVQYITNLNDFTDTLVITEGTIERSIPGPWSALSKEKRNDAVKCYKENKQQEFASCGLYDYGVLQLSPSGNYIELVWIGWESTMWKMLDTRTGKVVLSNDNGVIKSLWSNDKKRFAFETDSCEIGGCNDETGMFVTKADSFPQYEKIGDLNNIK